jgi:very-short-patch-repair endonuclease
MERLPTILIPHPLASLKSSPDEAIAVLKQTTPPMGYHVKPPKGRSESQFERDLWQYFPGKIHTGVQMLRSGYSQPYVPDFAYINSATGLHLDIEIDEPYTRELEPLHYFGCPKDAIRNQAFLDWGWVVIRFSERQVVKAPASCCKTIASVIAELTGDSAIMNAFRQVPTLTPDRRWTEAEARQLATQGDRDTYLKPANLTELKPKRKRKNSQTQETRSLLTSGFTFYCPECGEGPIHWQGHYVCCPNCLYDAFVL